MNQLAHLAKKKQASPASQHSDGLTALSERLHRQLGGVSEAARSPFVDLVLEQVNAAHRAGVSGKKLRKADVRRVVRIVRDVLFLYGVHESTRNSIVNQVSKRLEAHHDFGVKVAKSFEVK